MAAVLMLGTDLARLVMRDGPTQPCGRCRAAIERAGWRVEWSRLSRGWLAADRFLCVPCAGRVESALRGLGSGWP